MFFRRPPIHSIDTAREMIDHAMQVAYGYKHNSKYIPTEEEVEKFERFEQELWRHYTDARYILRSMNQRLYGRPEKSGDWPKYEPRSEPAEKQPETPPEAPTEKPEE